MRLLRLLDIDPAHAAVGRTWYLFATMKTWLTRCAWTDEQGGLHIDVPQMLDELGVPDTPEYREAAVKMTTELLQKMLKDTPAVIKVTE